MRGRPFYFIQLDWLEKEEEGEPRRYGRDRQKANKGKGACVDGLSVYFYTDLPGGLISKVSQKNDLLRGRISSVLGDPNT